MCYVVWCDVVACAHACAHTHGCHRVVLRGHGGALTVSEWAVPAAFGQRVPVKVGGLQQYGEGKQAWWPRGCGAVLMRV